MPGESNKINLQTSVTDLSTIYYLLSKVKETGVVEEQYSRSVLFPNARARVKTVGADWDPNRRDTHTGLTLRELGLIEYVDDDHFKVSHMGNRFLSGFRLVETPVSQTQVAQQLDNILSDSNRVDLLLTMLMGARIVQPEYGRDVHPYGLLLRLLDDEDLDYKLSKAEWAWIANDSSALSDSQYDEFVQWIKDFREDPTEVDLLKTDRTLTKLKAWGILQEISGNGQATSYSLSVLSRRVLVVMKNKYLASIRTKPFILLAGISGTGKSRMVRQLARGCCPEKDAAGNVHPLRDEQKPGNFEIIPVRPNWHDSTELMGYVTRITTSHKPEFVIKPFVRFLAKAMVYKDVPFFLCLDEMNLAPVEQYFAEYLSAVETRKKTANGIVSDVLVNFDLPEIDVKATVKALMKDWIDIADDDTFTEKIPNVKAVYDAIVADKGLRIPPNLVVMGTVNMDETTCSFSRKVLDRAMTFELNEVNMDEGLASDNSITYGSIPAAQAFATDVEGCDFYTANQTLCDTVKTYLLSVNAVLDDTPFKFAYRSRNEIMLYCVERTKGGVVSLARALDEATSMKILSRIEGDDQKLLYVGNNPAYKDKTILDALKGEIAAALRVANGGTEPTDCTVCAKKLDFMARRLDGGFTNFFV